MIEKEKLKKKRKSRFVGLRMKKKCDQWIGSYLNFKYLFFISTD